MQDIAHTDGNKKAEQALNWTQNRNIDLQKYLALIQTKCY